MNSETKKVVILGAGITGLTCAWKLAEKGFGVVVLEKKDNVGGLSSSFHYKDSVIDYGPHKIYTQIDEVLSELKKLVGDDMLEQPKKSKVRLKGKYFDYPVAIPQLLTRLNPITSFGCGMSFFLAKASGKKDAKTYEEYILQRFGKNTYELVFKDLASKVWGDPKTLDAELARTRVSIPDLLEMLKRIVIGDRGKKEISAKTFYYPKQGIQEISDKMVDKIEEKNGKIMKGVNLRTFVSNNAGRITKIVFEHEGKNKTLDADFFVSTIPLDDCVSLFDSVPEKVLEACSKLQYRALILLFLVIKKDRLFEDSFIFYPEKEFEFNRLSEQKAFSKTTVPEGKTILCAEITCDKDSERYNMTDKQLFETILPSIEKTGFCNRSEVEEFFTKRGSRVYPVYSVGFADNLKTVLAFLDEKENLITVGRQGLFNYNNIDHCMDMGFKTAKHIEEAQSKQQWDETRNSFSKYVIID